ncbi:uncharacterized protein PV09_06005 [Verruconis gallopava]|uniref:Uncharacterized protein n=1 Tax=Verruconis gallopava TaxID=253628 RepID=A0A0D2ATV9_9PEZI|nr:uncharacterized protein PV09_06005 [Verruconis gallopava]KIW02549.1 hypothetical protein PV09_06005 [Verruconis gallopava]
MDSSTWLECWKLIDKYAGWCQNGPGGVDDISIDYVDLVHTASSCQIRENKVLNEGSEAMDLPPTPRSSRDGSSKPSPKEKAVHTFDRNGNNVGRILVNSTGAEDAMDDVGKITEKLVDRRSASNPHPAHELHGRNISETPTHDGGTAKRLHPKRTPRGQGRKRTGLGKEETVKKPERRPAKEIPAYTNAEHLARGWVFQDRTVFERMSAAGLREHIRSVAELKPWWNGLTRKATIDKIMEWQMAMRIRLVRTTELVDHGGR